MTQIWMILLMTKEKKKRKFLDTLRRSLVMIDPGKVSTPVVLIIKLKEPTFFFLFNSPQV